MIAKARAIPHGNAYVTYATLKKDAILVGTLNMDCDNVLSLNPAEDAWEEFKNENFKNHNRMWEEHKSNPNFHIPKKEVTRTLGLDLCSSHILLWFTNPIPISISLKKKLQGH